MFIMKNKEHNSIFKKAFVYAVYHTVLDICCEYNIENKVFFKIDIMKMFCAKISTLDEMLLIISQTIDDKSSGLNLIKKAKEILIKVPLNKNKFKID